MNAVEKIFLDTNVLVYAHDRQETVKGPQAAALLNRITVAGQPLLSIQVLSEFYWAATRKIPLPLTHDEAVAEIKRFSVLMMIAPLTGSILTKALEAIRQHGLPLWDAQIFGAAILQGATTILSEDFQHRRVIEGITFLNPFAPDFDLAELSIP